MNFYSFWKIGASLQQNSLKYYFQWITCITTVGLARTKIPYSLQYPKLQNTSVTQFQDKVRLIQTLRNCSFSLEHSLTQVDGKIFSFLTHLSFFLQGSFLVSLFPPGGPFNPTDPCKRVPKSAIEASSKIITILSLVLIE